MTLDTATLLFAVAAVLVGSQLVLFYVLAKCQAVATGMLPASERFDEMRPMLSVDRFCLVGGGLFMAGLLVALVAAFRWLWAGFGDLDASLNVRLAAVATLLMALGVQSFTAGFLLVLVQRQKQPGSADRSDDEAPPLARDADGAERSSEKSRPDKAA